MSIPISQFIPPPPPHHQIFLFIKVIYIPIKRNEVLIHATTWMKLAKKGLRRQHKVSHIVGFYLYEMSRRGRFIRDRIQISGCQELAGGEDESNWHGISFGGDES